MERMLGAWELSSRVHSRCHLVSCSETDFYTFIRGKRVWGAHISRGCANQQLDYELKKSRASSLIVLVESEIKHEIFKEKIDF